MKTIVVFSLVIAVVASFRYSDQNESQVFTEFYLNSTEVQELIFPSRISAEDTETTGLCVHYVNESITFCSLVINGWITQKGVGFSCLVEHIGTPTENPMSYFQLCTVMGKGPITTVEGFEEFLQLIPDSE